MDRTTTFHLPSFWRLQIIGWSCFFVYDFLSSIVALLGKRESLDEQALPIVLMFLGSCALHRFCRSLLRRSGSWMSFELRAAAGAVVTSVPVSCATGLVMQFSHRVTLSSLVSVFTWSTLVLFMWCSLYFSIKQWQQANQERERLLRAESEAREARLLALRYQLNPHFLFNSLNAVSTLVLDGNAPAATRMLAQIGDLLRSSLDSEVIAEVALAQEFAFTQGYLAIEQTRLGDRLNFDMVIPTETRDALVPSMLLQPLVENAVRYGVAPLVEGGRIAITSMLRAGRLRIVIGNSGPRGGGQKNMNGNGIGLGNTAERLKTLYGTNFEFSLGWPEIGGCEVVLELPFRHAAQLREATACAF
jgi:two-component system LytT family sensor kinase